MNAAFSHFARLPAMALCVLLLFVPRHEARAGAVTLVYSFRNQADGFLPSAPLTAGTDGLLYGTTYYGGSANYGIAFKITTDGSLTPLHPFSYDPDGGNMDAGLAFGPDGKLYGEAQEGGADSDGTIFSLTTSGSFSLLYTLSNSGSSGYFPEHIQMMTGTDGILYGASSDGGTQGNGVIFQLTTSGSFTPIHEMMDSEGSVLYAGLCTGPGGDLYGVATYGGDNGYGTVFRITTSGSLTVIHSFDLQNDGGYPQTALIAGTDGFLYGMTSSGGLSGSGYGTVFQVAPTPGGAFNVLHNFTNAKGDGASPVGGALVQTSNGAFYGTTPVGGDYTDGTIFKLNVSGTTATYKVVHSFGQAEGSSPSGGLATGTDGFLYGTATSGGQSSDGTVFRFIPGAPEFSALPLSGLSSSQVVFNATVNPNGTPTTVYFRYGTNSSTYGSTTPPQVLGSGSGDIVVSAPVSGLSSSTTYYYQLVVTSSTYGAFSDSEQNFVTLNTPTIIPGPATNILSFSAVLTGTINTNSEDTQVSFLYGPDISYGFRSAAVSIGNSTDNVTVAIPVTGLMPDTEYHFLMETTGSAGSFYGSDVTFTTTGGSAVSITENPAQNVTSFSALLSGTINPNGGDLNAWFQYGLTSSYTNSTSVKDIGNSRAPATVLGSLTGLSPNTRYHYALTGSSGGLVVSGSDMTFMTSAITPGISQNSAGSVTTGGASLSGSANPGGLDSHAYFVYGLTGTYGSQTATVDLGNGTTALGLDETLTGLAAGTTYHYELVVTNSNGAYFGGDQTFTTGTIPALVASAEAKKGDIPTGVPGTFFASFNPPIINANGHVAFSATLASGSTKVTTANNSGIWADDSNGIRRLIAQTGGTTAGVSGATFSSLGNPVYNDNEEIAFIAGVKSANGTNNAIFTNIGGSLNMFRIQGAQADAVATGVLYKAFLGLVLTDASLVFEASLGGANVTSANNTGIWVTRLDSGQTQLIARTGSVDPSTGKTIKTLTIFPVVPVVAGQSRNSDTVAGNIVYQATFTDGTGAVLKTAAP